MALSFVVASDDKHVVISDMTKRISRIALPGGEVVAQTSTAMPDDVCLLYELGDRVLALGRKGMAVIDDKTLEVVASRSLERPHYLPIATTLAGDAFVTGKYSVWELHRLNMESEVPTLEVLPLPSAQRPLAAAFSPDGRLLALATKDGVRVLDSRSLEETGSRETGIKAPGTIHCVAFDGNDHLAVGWGLGLVEKAPGVLVYDLGSDAPPEELMSRSPRATSGVIRSILCDPGGGRLLFGIAPAGILAGFQLEDDAWTEAFAVEYQEGTWSGFRLRGGPGGDEVYVSGMNPQHSSVVHIDSGELLMQHQVQGLFRLQSAGQGRFLVGLRAGRLVVKGR
ncbi:hypothetical protein [Planctomycetes bacterium Poly30]